MKIDKFPYLCQGIVIKFEQLATYDGVAETSEESDSEEPQGKVNVGFGADEEEPSNEKSWNVLQVIQVGPSDSLDVFVFLYLHVRSIAHIFGILICLAKRNI